MAKSQRVAQYMSDEESENNSDMELKSSSDGGNVSKKRTQKRRKWISICTYDNKDDAINQIKNE